jgi:CRISPR-associated exonuclease Cas4
MKMDTESTLMLQPTEVLEHVWCPRFTWFMQVHGIAQHEETRFKVLKGREIHARRERENPDYLRKKLGAIKKEIGVYLASPTLRLRGIVDELLWLKDGSLAPLDYKFTDIGDKESIHQPHRVQILIYAMLAQEIYQLPVHKGLVAYIRGGSKVLEIPFLPEHIQEVQRYVDEIFDIIRTGKQPKRTPHRPKCTDCCYKNICI